MILYRGFNNDYHNFGVRPEQNGLWLTDDYDFALEYAKLYDNGVVAEIELDDSIKLMSEHKAFDVFGDDFDVLGGDYEYDNMIGQQLRDMGYDGFYFDDGGVTNYSIFNWDLIKRYKIIDNNALLDESVEYNSNGGIDLKLNDDIKQKIKELEQIRSSTHLGSNLYDDEFEEWVAEQLYQEELNRINELSIDDINLIEDIDDANEEIEYNPNANEYNRTEPFAEEEWVEYWKNIFKDDAKNTDVSEWVADLDSYNWDYYRDKFIDSYSNRDDFFLKYEFLITDIIEYNGLETRTENSRISDSIYIYVYENGKEKPLANIRISDHNTRKFYGDNINLYTTKPVNEEIDKLINAFKTGNFGINDSVY